MASPVLTVADTVAPLPFFDPLFTAKSKPSKNFRNSGSTLSGFLLKSWYKLSTNEGCELVIYEKSFIFSAFKNHYGGCKYRLLMPYCNCSIKIECSKNNIFMRKI